MGGKTAAVLSNTYFRVIELCFNVCQTSLRRLYFTNCLLYLILVHSQRSIALLIGPSTLVSGYRT